MHLKDPHPIRHFLKDIHFWVNSFEFTPIPVFTIRGENVKFRHHIVEKHPWDVSDFSNV